MGAQFLRAKARPSSPRTSTTGSPSSVLAIIRPRFSPLAVAATYQQPRKRSAFSPCIAFIVPIRSVASPVSLAGPFEAGFLPGKEKPAPALPARVSRSMNS